MKFNKDAFYNEPGFWMMVFACIILLILQSCAHAEATPDNANNTIREGNHTYIETTGDIKIMELDQEKFELMGKLNKLRLQMNSLKHRTEDLIIEECKYEYLPTYLAEFYYCTMSTMYAMNRTMRHYDDLVQEFYDEGPRTHDQLADDFETFVMLWEQHQSDQHFGGWNWYGVYKQYEEYLEEVR